MDAAPDTGAALPPTENTMSAHPMKLYRFHLSGHSHRVQLALSLMGLPFEMIEVNLAKGEHKTASFLSLHPFGQVPVLDDDGTIVYDSNAILVYLASKYGAGRWLPSDPAGAAAVQAWLSVAAGQIAFGPAAARLVNLFGAKFNQQEVVARSHAMLAVVDRVLGQRDWLAGADISIADIACYTYVAAAGEGSVDLAGYPAVRAWLARIEALPGFVPFKRSAVGLNA
jgi:glutathione S-transferase